MFRPSRRVGSSMQRVSPSATPRAAQARWNSLSRVGPLPPASPGGGGTSGSVEARVEKGTGERGLELTGAETRDGNPSALSGEACDGGAEEHALVVWVRHQQQHVPAVPQLRCHVRLPLSHGALRPLTDEGCNRRVGSARLPTRILVAGALLKRSHRAGCAAGRQRHAARG